MKVKVNGQWVEVPAFVANPDLSSYAKIDDNTQDLVANSLTANLVTLGEGEINLATNDDDQLTYGGAVILNEDNVVKTEGEQDNLVYSKGKVDELLAGAGGNFQLVATVSSDDTTERAVKLLNSCTGYKEIVIRRETTAAVSTNVYISLKPAATSGSSDTKNLAITVLNSTRRTVWIIHLDKTITYTEQFVYNYGNDTLRCDTAKGICTAFGLTDTELAKPLWIDFYNLTQAPSGETYYVYAK